jgi:hypothetical protein
MVACSYHIEPRENCIYAMHRRADYFGFVSQISVRRDTLNLGCDDGRVNIAQFFTLSRKCNSIQSLHRCVMHRQHGPVALIVNGE